MPRQQVWLYNGIATKPAPVWQDFSLFFETILNTTNFNSAVDALNKSNNNPFKYHFFSSEEFLELVLKKLETSDFNPKSIENRLWVNSLVKRLRILSPEYAQIRRKNVKEIVRKQLHDQGSILRQDARKVFLTVT